MKLASYKSKYTSKTAVGLLINECLYDIYQADWGTLSPPPDMLSLIQLGDTTLDILKHFQTNISNSSNQYQGEAIEAVDWLPALINPSKIIAIGANYRDHCAETGLPVPAFPTVFAKFASALNAHEKPIVYPDLTQLLDYEVELAFVVGKESRNVKKETALSCIFGYTIMNDVSARDIQRDERQWVRAKSFDTFAPCGPYIVTSDEIQNPNTLEISTKVNGEYRQKSNTNEMVFDIPYLFENLSRCFTLNPGDIVTTGTPAGVGMFRKPQSLLNKGDVVECSIEKIGTLRNRIV